MVGHFKVVLAFEGKLERQIRNSSVDVPHNQEIKKRLITDLDVYRQLSFFEALIHVCKCDSVPFHCYEATPKVQKLPCSRSPCLYCLDSTVIPSWLCLEGRYADIQQLIPDCNK